MVRSLETSPSCHIRSPCAPRRRVCVQRAKAIVRRKIGREVRKVHVVVAVRQQRVAQRGEYARVVVAEVIGEDQVERGAGLRFIVVVPARGVPAAAGGDLLGGQAKEEEIVFPCLLRHLDRRAVACADRQGAVQS